MSTQFGPVSPGNSLPSSKERLLTVKEAADRLGVSLRTLEDWIYDHKIEVVKLGRRCVRIKESTIDHLIEVHTRPAVGRLA
jgi:excisionase family DNA binding protein